MRENVRGRERERERTERVREISRKRERTGREREREREKEREKERDCTHDTHIDSVQEERTETNEGTRRYGGIDHQQER